VSRTASIAQLVRSGEELANKTAKSATRNTGLSKKLPHDKGVSVVHNNFIVTGNRNAKVAHSTTFMLGKYPYIYANFSLK